MMDLLISVYLLQEYTFHSQFFFIVIIIERSTILTNMRSQQSIPVKIDARNFPMNDKCFAHIFTAQNFTR